ncbi:MAG: ImmA/IrrE family metallo-endopeptidase [Bacteriovoracia bacterium]
MNRAQLGENIKSLRERLSMSQAKLADLMGWGTHVTVSTVEAGSRELKASELVKLAECLKVDIYKLLGENTQKPVPYFFWRGAPDDAPMASNTLLKKADDYTFIERIVGAQGEFQQLPHHDLDLNSTNKAHVERWADEVRRSLDLGRYPAEGLVKVLEENFGVRFILDDFEYGGSGATFSSDEFGSCIFLSSKEPFWRQNFSIAHELFHLITWNTILFDQINSDEELYKKNEKLADTFAASLLMPLEVFRDEISKIISSGQEFHLSHVFSLAHQFGVGSESLLYRMVSAGFIKFEVAQAVLNLAEFKSANKIQNDSRGKVEISDRLLRLSHQAMMTGKLSRSKFAKLIGVSLHQLTKYLAEKGLPDEIEDCLVEISNP